MSEGLIRIFLTLFFFFFSALVFAQSLEEPSIYVEDVDHGVSINGKYVISVDGDPSVFYPLGYAGAHYHIYEKKLNGEENCDTEEDGWCLVGQNGEPFSEDKFSVSLNRGDGVYEYKAKVVKYCFDGGGYNDCFRYPDKYPSYIENWTIIKKVVVDIPSEPGKPKINSIPDPLEAEDGTYSIGWKAPTTGDFDYYLIQERKVGGANWCAGNNPYNTEEDQHGHCYAKKVSVSSPRNYSVSGRGEATYRYRVFACNALECGDPSPVEGVTVQKIPAPEITWKKPSRNQVLRAGQHKTLTVSVDDGGTTISNVKFYRNKVSSNSAYYIGIATDIDSSIDQCDNCYSVNWPSVSAGTSKLIAVALNEADKKDREEQPITVDDNDHPEVGLDLDALPEKIVEDQEVTLLARARDLDGSIDASRVQFLLGGDDNVIGTGTKVAPEDGWDKFELKWTVPQAGTYSLGVRVYDNEGASTQTFHEVTFAALEAPEPPTTISITGVSGSEEYPINGDTPFTGDYYRVSWSEAAGATHFRLHEGKDGNFDDPTWYESDGLSVTIPNQAHGVYTYRVVACNAAGCSNDLEPAQWSPQAFVDVVRIAPQAPADLAAASVHSGFDITGRTELGWNPVTTSPKPRHYLVEEKPGGVDSTANWSETGRLPHSEEADFAPRFTVADRQPGTYSYRVNACNAETSCSDGGEIVTVEVVPPTLVGADAACDGQCLRVAGSGLDPDAAFTLTNRRTGARQSITKSDVDWHPPVHDGPVEQRDPTTYADLPLTAAMKKAFEEQDGVHIAVEMPNDERAAVDAYGSETVEQLSQIDSAPAVGTDGTVYVGSGNRVYALSPEDGAVKSGWPFATQDLVKATPTIDSVNGNIYVGSLDDHLYALTPYGLEQWRLKTGGDLVASAVLDENRILYQGSMDGALYAVQAQNGAVQWTYPAAAGIAETPVLAGNGTLYFTTVDSTRVHALGRGILGPDQLAWESSDDSLLKDSMESLDWQPSERHLPEYKMAARLYRLLLQPELSLSRDVLTFWTYALVNGATSEEVAAAFLASDTGVANFPPNQGDAAFVDALYERAFPGQGQPAFTHGGELYTRNGLLDAMAGGASRAQVAMLFAQSVEYIAATGQLLRRSFDYMYVQDYSWAVFSCEEGDEYTRDCDADGLPDYWEILYFGSDDIESGDSDADGDGVSNRDAFLAGIDPCAELCHRGVLNEAPAPAAAPVLDAGQLAISAQTGSLPGKFRVNESGAASYSIPLSLPAGTAGVAPEISLNYSSQSGNGLVGHGWAIGGLSAISRCRQTLGQDGQAKVITWGSEDRFCLDGQRLLLVQGEYGEAGSQYRTEVDSFALVQARKGASGNLYFTAERKDGSISYYGRHEDSRQTTGQGTLSWGLSTFEDSARNRIEFLYARNGGHRISEVRYAFTDTGSDRHTGYKAGLIFDYENRPDPIRGYIAGELLETGKRLTAVRVRNNSGGGMQEVRRYELDYLIYPADHLSRLGRIRQCAGSLCQPDTVFDWRLPLPGSFAGGASDSVTMNTQRDRLAVGTRPADINGDGRMDLIWLEANYDNDGSGKLYSQHIKYILAEEDGFGDERTVYSKQERTGKLYKWQMIDYNADGRSDLLIYLKEHGYWGIVLSRPDAQGIWSLSGNPRHLEALTERHAKFADINGDGLVDYLTQTSYRLLKPAGSPSSDSYYAFGDAQTATLDIDWSSVDWDSPVESEVVNRSARMRQKTAPADFNGDGLVDPFVDLSMTSNCEPEPGGHPRPCYHAGGVAITASSGLGEYRSYLYLGSVTSPEASDINGDGLPDVVYRKGTEGFYRINNGDGFEEPVSLGEFPEHRQYFDYDNDGDNDLVWHDHEAHRLKVRRWNSLDGEYGEFGEAESFRTTSGNEYALHLFVDMNGDGVSDYVRAENDRAYLYPATDFRVPVNVVEKITNGLGAETEIDYGSLTRSGHYTRRDIAATTEKRCTNAKYGDTYPEPGEGDFYPWCRDYAVADLADYYGYLNDPWAGDQQLGKLSPALELMGPMYLVTRVDSSAPTGGNTDAKSAVSYYYAQAKIQAGGRGMLGFEKLTTVDEQTGVETTTTYRQDFPFRGSPQSTVVKTADGKKLSESVNTWKLKNADGDAWQEDWQQIARADGSAELGPLQPWLAKIVEKTYALNGSGDDPVKTVTTANKYDNHGNPDKITVTTEAGNGDTFVTVTDNTYGGAGDIVTFDRLQRELSSYAELGRLTRTEVEHRRTVDGVTDEETRTSSFGYHPDGPEAGLLAWEKIEPGSDFELTTSYQYDGYGNKKKATQETAGEEPRSSQWRYVNNEGRYLKWEKNTYGQKTREVIERNQLGLPLQVADIAGVSTFLEYDAFGRKALEYSETGAHSITLLAAAGSYCPEGSAYQQTVREAGGGESLTCFDVLARETRSGTRGFDGQRVFADTEYDKLGRTRRKSEPYRDSALYWTVMDYDILGRVVGTDMPGTVSHNGYVGSSGTPHDVHVEYEGYRTITTNPNGHTKTETKNAQGELVSVVDNLGGRIEYRYDAQGNLRFVTRTGDEGLFNTEIEMQYDKLGRKIYMDDPDKGEWHYGYNGFGELVWQIDAKQQVVVNEYDWLGRQKNRTDYRNVPIEGTLEPGASIDLQALIDGAEVEANTDWFYNNEAEDYNGDYELTVPPGSLIGVIDLESGYVQSMGYDGLGRPDVTLTVHEEGGEEHWQQTTYDQFGRTFQQFDAGGDGFTGSATENRYNNYGYLQAVVDGEAVNQASAEIYYEVLAMDERGNVTRFKQGNGVVTDRTYDPENGRLLNQTASVAGAFQVQNLTYQWDNLGNLKNRRDQSGDKDLFEEFQYDGLNRLKKAQVSGPQGQTREAQTLEYDGLGNIEYKSDVGDYHYADDDECHNPAGPHAVCATSDGVQYRYDANGNMVEDSGRNLEYSTFDKPLRIENTETGHVTEFQYGPDRKRYQRIDTAPDGEVTETRYIGNVEKIRRPDGTEEIKRYLPGGAVVTLTGGERESRYLHKDHLGSVDVITDASGSVVQEMSFDPWGQRRNAQSWEALVGTALTEFDTSITTRGYTGHETLDQVGLIHMNGRIYDPRLGRFLQADPFVQAASDTQMFNRYSYVRNNPLNATDPSGHFVFTLMATAMVAAGAVESVVAVGLLMGAAGFLDALSQGASFKDALKAGFIQGISAAAFAGIGQALPGAENVGGRMLASGVTGGITSVLQGGKFGHGFVSAGIGAAVGGALRLESGAGWANVGKAAARIAIAGTVSRATGGKFGNAAAFAAFSVAVEAGSISNAGSGHTEGDAPTPKPAGLTDKERAALDAEIAAVNESAGQNIAATPDEVASWIHEKAYGISTEYGVELGAGIRSYGDGYGFDALTTDYSVNTVTIRPTLARNGYKGRWHSHPKSANSFWSWDIENPVRYRVNGYLSNQGGLEKFNYSAFSSGRASALGVLATESKIAKYTWDVIGDRGKPYVESL